MADTFTPNYNLVLPEVGGSPDTWGGKLNQNFSELDAVLGQMQQDEEGNAPFRVPQGGIILWSGAVDNIPTGWALCNGSNGTPDLRDRFIVGAGSTYSVGNTGGANSVTLTAAQMPTHNHSATTASAGAHTHGGSTGNGGGHSHTGTTASGGGHTHTASTGSAGSHSHSGSTNTTGSHSHTQRRYTTATGLRIATTTNGGGAGQTQDIPPGTGFAGNHSHSLNINSNGSHTHTVSVSSVGGHTHTLTTSTAAAHNHSISSDGGHTHTMTVGNAGSGNSHENRPPYYALAYIMKL